MDPYYVGGRSSEDQTVTSDGSESPSWLLHSSVRRRRFSASPSANAFLGPAFNACGATSVSGSPLDIDPSLLRYTRSRLHFSSSSSSLDSSDLARKRLQHLLQLRSSLSSSSSSSVGSIAGRSPLSQIENRQVAVPARSPSVYKAKSLNVEVVEEDVLVMDGVLVGQTRSSRSRGSAEFGSSASSSASNDPNSLFKTEMCRSWEDTGTCRYGSKCQFAHGKEDLRSPRPCKQKPEVIGQSSKYELSAGSWVQGSRFPRHVPPIGAGGPTRPPPPPPPPLPRSSQPPPRSPSFEPSFRWPPTREEDEYITQVLYGPSHRRRLPVFENICPQ